MNISDDMFFKQIDGWWFSAQSLLPMWLAVTSRYCAKYSLRRLAIDAERPFGPGAEQANHLTVNRKVFCWLGLAATEANAPGRFATQLLIIFVQQDRLGIENGRCLALVYRLSRQEIPNLGRCGENIKKPMRPNLCKPFCFLGMNYLANRFLVGGNLFLWDGMGWRRVKALAGVQIRYSLVRVGESNSLDCAAGAWVLVKILAW